VTSSHARAIVPFKSHLGVLVGSVGHYPGADQGIRILSANEEV